MLQSLASNDFLVILVLVFITALLLFEGLYMMWRSRRGPQARKFNSRLQALAATRDKTQQTQLLKQRLLSELPMLERRLQSLPRMRGLDRFLVQSGLGWTVSKLLLSSAVLGGATWMV